VVVLGISAFFHDAAAALLVDGQLVAAAEEERFSGRKHDSRFPVEAIRFCLEAAGLKPGDVDYAVFYEKPAIKLERALATALATAPRSADPFVHLLARGPARLTVRDRIRAATGVDRERVLFVDHHLSHAASAFFASPFREAAIVTVDGVGEWATTSLGEGAGGHVVLHRTMAFPHSLGLLYSVFTEYLGFEVNDGEYKVMGLAAYGEPRFREELDRVVHRYDDGSLWLDMKWFAYHRGTKTGFDDRLTDLLGVPPRPRGADLAIGDGRPAGPRDRAYADLAATVQAFTEDAVVAMARRALQLTGHRDLCLAGGVALNGVANNRVLERSGARDVFIPPSPGDAGAALGCALYAQHVLLGQPRSFVMEHAYWGAEFGSDRVVEALDRSGYAYERHPDPAALVERVAGALAGGAVVGWFQGRFEWGPRALGNRSILADPRSPEMKERINRKVKFREVFRPFAPAMLDECAPDYVHGRGARQWPSRFMLLVLPLREGFAGSAPAIDHFGTARIQTVAAGANPLFHALISGFRERTGIGCLLNTSFNLRGEPIVATPEHAISTFERSELDLLVIEDCVVSRR
jgi:carbamoyltransferase